MKLLHSRYFRLTYSQKLVLFMAPFHSEFQVPKNDQKGCFLGINCILVKTHTPRYSQELQNLFMIQNLWTWVNWFNFSTDCTSAQAQIIAATYFNWILTEIIWTNDDMGTWDYTMWPFERFRMHSRDQIKFKIDLLYYSLMTSPSFCHLI